MHLLNDLLDISKLEAGKMEYRFAPHDLQELAAGVAEEFSEPAAARGVRRLIAPAPEPCHGEFDALRIEQVLRNLISNAVKYTPADKEVRLAVTSSLLPARICCPACGPVAGLRVEVEDQGVGIRPEEQELVFDKFVQSSTTKTGAGGTGLGLAICREILHAHGGETFAASAASGGAVFTASFPAAPCPLHAPPVPAHPG